MLSIPNFQDVEIILGLIVWVIVLFGTVKFAGSRGRSQMAWFNIVLFCPPALIVLIILPNLRTQAPLADDPSAISDFLRRCSSCKKLVDAEKEICPVCGAL